MPPARFSSLLPLCLLTLMLSACGGGAADSATAPPPSGSDPQQPAPVDPAPPADPPQTLEQQLRSLVAAAGVTPLAVAPVIDDALFNAGQALFSSTLLSGARTVSCASCHPTNNAGTEVGLALHASLSGGTIHRNAPDLVNKALDERHALFWDGRVSVDDAGQFHSPASALPAGLANVAAVQALFPLLSRDEMLGHADDGTDNNELADLNGATPPESDPAPVWNGIVARVLADATLGPLLRTAWPDVAPGELGIQHIANALAAFEVRRWNPPTLAPAFFHAWLAGSGDLTDQAKRGGILFFTKAGCGRCHNGPLFSDGRYHNLAVPQVGPGFAAGAGMTPPRDEGRYGVSGDSADLYAFATPSLWEAKVTPPYMHDGVYTSLAQVVRHHLDAAATALAFRCTDANVPTGAACRDSQNAPELYADLVNRLAPELATPVVLTDDEFADLLAFLNQLTNGAN